MCWCFESSLPRILKRMAPYSLHTQVRIVVATVPLHNYIRQKAQKDRLFKKYDNNELIIIKNDDDNTDEKLERFKPSHLTNEMDLFQDGLTSLMQGTRVITSVCFVVW